MYKIHVLDCCGYLNPYVDGQATIFHLIFQWVFTELHAGGSVRGALRHAQQILCLWKWNQNLTHGVYMVNI